MADKIGPARAGSLGFEMIGSTVRVTFFDPNGQPVMFGDVHSGDLPLVSGFFAECEKAVRSYGPHAALAAMPHEGSA